MHMNYLSTLSSLHEMATLKAAAVDLLKITPPLGWLIVCIVAIPSYTHLKWVAPVVCAIYSAIVSLLATIDIFRHHATTLNHYLPLLNSAQPEANAEARDTSNAFIVSRMKIIVAAGSVFFSVFFAIFFLVVGYVVIDPKKDSMPCNGKCQDCGEDPDCSNWIADVEKQHPIVNVCPAARPSADTDATFSCLADGYWMIVTAFVCGIWLYAAWVQYSYAKDEDSEDEASVVGRRNELVILQADA